MGHDVTVLTTQKQLPPSQMLNLADSGARLIEVPMPKRFQQAKQSHMQRASQPTGVLHWLRKQRGVMNACRMPDATDFWAPMALKKAKSLGTFDLVISTSGPYSVHHIAYHIDKRFWVADFRDLWVDNHMFRGLFPFTLLEQFLERRVVQRANLITTVSDGLKDTLLKRYPSADIHVIENGFDPDDIKELRAEQTFPKDGMRRIVYTGTLYPKYTDWKPILHALNDINNVELVFVGHNMEPIKEEVKKLNLESHVQVLPPVSREKALQMQRDANMLLFLPWNDPNHAGVLTGKLFEYLFSQTPILTIGGQDQDQSRQLIQKLGAGPLLPANSSTIANFLNYNPHVENSIDLKRLNRYNRKHLAEKILKLCPLQSLSSLTTAKR